MKCTPGFLGLPKAASNLKAKFESMALDNAQEIQKRTEAERQRRKVMEDEEREASKKAEEERQKLISEEHRRLEEEEERERQRTGEVEPEEEKKQIKPSQQAFRYDLPSSSPSHKIAAKEPLEREVKTAVDETADSQHWLKHSEKVEKNGTQPDYHNPASEEKTNVSPVSLCRIILE